MSASKACFEMKWYSTPSFSWLFLGRVVSVRIHVQNVCSFKKKKKTLEFYIKGITDESLSYTRKMWDYFSTLRMSLSCTALYCVWSGKANSRGTAIPYRCGFSAITLCFSSLIRAPRDPWGTIREKGEKSDGENWILLLYQMPKRHIDMVNISTNCLDSHRLTPPVWVCLKASADSVWPLHRRETWILRTLQAESLQKSCADPYDLTGNFS